MWPKESLHVFYINLDVNGTKYLISPHKMESIICILKFIIYITKDRILYYYLWKTDLEVVFPIYDFKVIPVFVISY